jgi:hypothetical protein
MEIYEINQSLFSLLPGIDFSQQRWTESGLQRTPTPHSCCYQQWMETSVVLEVLDVIN